jgi:hypothetical protein
MFQGFWLLKSYVDDAAKQAASPSPEQAKAGNYAKGHADVGGLNVAIETPKGGVRRGVDKNGNAWETTMPAHYGYIKQSEGADGDHVDVSLGPKAHEAEQHPVHVINQVDPETGKFDEHKCQVGFASKDEALAAYDKSFSDGSGPTRRGSIKTMPFAEFLNWVKNGNTTKALQKVDNNAKPKNTYVHPYRAEDGKYTTKVKDATFKGTGTSREEHDANVATATKHGFAVARDHNTATELEKRRQKLTMDHGMGTFQHTIEYPTGGARSFKGPIQHLDEHLKKWS